MSSTVEESPKNLLPRSVVLVPMRNEHIPSLALPKVLLTRTTPHETADRCSAFKRYRIISASMAEVAAGLWAAEEVISTTVQAAIGAYMIAKPTMPLKATFTQITASADDGTR